jgi:photosystem II stability/assembly factor-like uncharacterized protein
VYVGTENGGLFRSLDAGVRWSANLASSELPKVSITRIETVPSNARGVYVTMANSGHSHVFHSPDAGSTWADIDGGKLPDVPHAAHPPDAQRSSRGQRRRVYLTRDGGVTGTTRRPTCRTRWS